jgi:hypothetical protein
LLHGDFGRREIERMFTNVSFICFNYDRCIEHYLFWAVRGLGVPETEAAEIVRRVPIVHPYGTLGPLPWQTDRNDGVAFGATGVHLPSIAGRIRTFTEEIADANDINRIQSTLCEARQIVFLGFAFYEQNMGLLKRSTQQPAMVRATAYGFSEVDRGDIHHKLLQQFHPSSSVFVHDLKCAAFFDQHQRVLTRGVYGS